MQRCVLERRLSFSGLSFVLVSQRPNFTLLDSKDLIYSILFVKWYLLQDKTSKNIHFANVF